MRAVKPVLCICLILTVLLGGCQKNTPDLSSSPETTTSGVTGDSTENPEDMQTTSVGEGDTTDTEAEPASKASGDNNGDGTGISESTGTSGYRYRENQTVTTTGDTGYLKALPAVVDSGTDGDEDFKLVMKKNEPKYEVRKWADIKYARQNDKDLLLDMYLPNKEGVFPVMVFFFGGELESGNKEALASVAWEFASQGIGVVTPAYRLYPDAVYPDFINDAAASVAWTQNNISKYAKTSGLFVGGHSAGAYLASMLCFDESYLKAAGADTEQIDGYIFASGQPTTHASILKHRGDNPDSVVIDSASPIYHVDGDEAPVLILCADKDTAVQLDQTRMLLDKLKETEYKNEYYFRLLKGYDHNNYLESLNGYHSALFLVTEPFIMQHK